MDAEFPPDFDAATIELCRAVKPFTMTSPERIYSLCRSVEYVVDHAIPGDIVECGVWKGGSMMAVAHTLLKKGASRKLYLFDTYQGMPEPTDVDVNITGQSAAHVLATEDRATSWNWAVSPLDEVRKNVLGTGYDREQVVFVEGRVEHTVPQRAPRRIALLRLDTDWYESTYHELVHLYPRLSTGGVLLIDDYGHWRGARRAVDRFLAEHRPALLLHRIDYTARIGVKLDPGS